MSKNNYKKSSTFENIDVSNFDNLSKKVESRLKIIKLKKIFKMFMIFVGICCVAIASWAIATIFTVNRNNDSLSPNLDKIVSQTVNKNLTISQDGAISSNNDLIVKSNQNTQTCNMEYIWEVSSDNRKTWTIIENNSSYDKFNLRIINVNVNDWKNKSIRLRININKDKSLISNVIDVQITGN